MLMSSTASVTSPVATTADLLARLSKERPLTETYLRRVSHRGEFAVAVHEQYAQTEVGGMRRRRVQSRPAVRRVVQLEAEERKEVDRAYADFAYVQARLANAATDVDDPLVLVWKRSEAARNPRRRVSRRPKVRCIRGGLEWAPRTQS